MIGRGARKRQAKGHVHRIAERRDFDRGHPHVVIWRDHRIELTTHRADENGIGGKWAGDSGLLCGRGQQLRVLISEPATVTSVRIERAQSNSWFGNAEPLLQSFARDGGRIDDRLCRHASRDVAQRKVGRRENDSQLVGGEHHRHPGAGELCQHLGVAGKIVTAGVQRGFIDWRCHNALDLALHRHFHGALNGETAQLSGAGGAGAFSPCPDRLGDGSAGSIRTDHHNVAALANPWVSERFDDYLWSNPAGIPDGHGKTHFHFLHPD
jgi:hypothetical protein